MKPRPSPGTTEQPRGIKVVIVGGGTAGWMAAVALGRLLVPAGGQVTLIESDAIATVGVGEATIPPIRTFHAMLGIDEDSFLTATGGSYKLGIRFEGWSRPTESYVHPFGQIGTDIAGLPFAAQWLRARQAGDAENLDRYSLEARAAETGRFSRPIANGDSPLSRIGYAYHFDAARYAGFLRAQAEAQGVIRREGTVTRVERGPAGIAAVHVADGTRPDGRPDGRIDGDLFIDCTGFRALLIEGALKAGWEDWSTWLPCDRAVAVPSSADAAPLPLTRAIAQPAGWRWRIPLRHRTGNGHVFCSRYMSEDQAVARLLDAIEGEALADPRVIRFATGHRRQIWSGNCIALGLAAGFMEPLESTSIHLVQSGLQHLLQMLPGTGAASSVVIERYNRVMTAEFVRIRDFLVAHYHLNARPETFWRDRAAAPIPEGLADKLTLFRHGGRIFRESDELFNETSWLSLLTGQNAVVEGHDPLCAALPIDRAATRIAQIEQVVTASLAHMPPHAEALARFERR
ncbi:tryptophan halogenase family protein [Sphingomonas sp. LB3N6]|uniref:tryptophan halogenase family protein n=1 Tax=Sphingomonas fucosidasi TaxID=3096164 RepID=UPI002FC9EA87